MRKYIIFLLASVSLTSWAQTQDWDGVTVVEHTYAQKISSNGLYIAGYSGEGGTVVYDREKDKASYFPYMSNGKGHCISDNGWVVGTQLIEDSEANHACIVIDGNLVSPSIFNPDYESNIHSITPDGSRICGVVGNPGQGYTYLPYYCDIDAQGNFGELQYLPTPSKDFFGYRPQYSSATWISNDGKTIAGQVIDSRGFVAYPIIYNQGEDGSWEYSFPSESLFNMNDLPIPEPVGDIEEMFPDAPYPEIEDFMDPGNYLKFVIAGEPYDNLEAYMTEEEIEAYYEAVYKYWMAQDAYNEIFESYMNQYWAIVDCSVFFTRNAMALSADAKWLASSASKDEVIDQFEVITYYEPYICNLETGEWTKFGEDRVNYHTNQVLENGMTVVNVISNGLSPASTYIYFPEEDRFMSLTRYLSASNPQYVEWIKKNLTGDVITGGDYDNPDYEKDVTFTGQASFSEDLSVIAGGADGYVLNKDMYITYIFTDVNAGVETLPVITEGIYNIYNLQGVKLMSTKNISDLKNLRSAIYIVNGKKVFIK